MVDLSIIIVNFNNSKILRECLRSVIENTKKIAYELIVVDNASTDDSVELVKSDFKEVRLIENKENAGFARANNQAFKYCTGKYVMLLNNDTKTLTGAFDKMVEHMESHPEAGAIGPKLLNTDKTTQRQGSVLGSKFWRSEEVRQVDFLTGACFILRKGILDEIGFLDENLLIYNEDLDLCRQIRKAGWKIVYYPKAEVVHYGSYSSRTFNRRVFVEGFRGGLYLCRKHYGAIAYHIYRILLPITLLLLCLTWIISFPFKPKEKKREYPQKFASLWEIFKIDLFGHIIPPKTI